MANTFTIRALVALYGAIALLIYLVCFLADLDANSMHALTSLGVFAAVGSFTMHIAGRVYLGVQAITWGV